MDGYLSTDDIQMGDLKGKGIKFAEATELADFFKDVAIDGIFGLAFKSISEDGVNPVYEQLYDQKLISTNAFGFYLTSKPNSAGSKLFLGAPNSKYFVGDLNWHDLSSADYWSLKVDGVTSNGEIQSGEGAHAIMDSGTSLFLMEMEYFEALNIPEINADCDGVDDDF